MFNSNNGGFGFDLGALLGNMASGNCGNGNGMWGEGLWAVIILAILFGWGNNGGGVFGGNNRSQGVSEIDASLQRGFDTQSIISKLDGITNGICSMGYDQLNQINGLSTAMMQASNASNIANLQSTNAIQNQIQNCCCGLEALLADAKYQRASDTCSITTAIDRVGDRIVANDNANFRALYDQQVELQMEALRQQNAALQRQLTTCDTQNMIAAGNQQVINALRDPTPNPAYIVPNPNSCGCNNNYGWFGNGFNWAFA